MKPESRESSDNGLPKSPTLMRSEWNQGDDPKFV